MILVDIGEVGIHDGGVTHKLRPSLYAMTQLGTPEEIVSLYASVMSETPHRDQFTDALAVIYACTEEDIGELFGGLVANDSGVKYEPGRLPPDDVIPLARCLLKHGVTGALEPLPTPPDEGPEYVRTFDARQYASLAVAHLGVGHTEAWSMTMTEILGGLRAKFPVTRKDTPGARAPTREEHEQTMAWMDRIDAARRNKKG